MQVSLACRATGARPPAKIQWFRNNVAFNLPEGEDDDDHDEDGDDDHEDDGNEVEDHRVDERPVRAQWSGNNVAFNLAEGE